MVLVTLLPCFVQAEPNIIIVMTDDLGWNDVGYHGSEIRTPHLDELASRGVVLKRFYTQPVCTPTRAALLTGKAPQRLGIYQPFTKLATEGLPPEEVTLADHLKGLGYQTWLVGKWHLGYRRAELHPLRRGFDHFYGNVTGGVGHYDHVHGGGLDWQRNGKTVREEGYTTHLLVEEAMSLIAEREMDQPFFLFLSFGAPHMPNEAPQETVATYADIENPYRRMHAAMVTEIDQAVGDLVELLEREEELNNTLIWFMSDNGGLNRNSQPTPTLVNLSERLESWFGPLSIPILELIRTNSLEGGADNSPLRYGKGSVYEGGTRVPSFAYWPRQIPAHQTEAFVSVQDVLPTLLGILDLEVPVGLDGGSRLEVLKREPVGPANDFVVRGVLEAQAYYQWPWKLITDGDFRALYKLDEDPLEQQDLSEEFPEQAAKLQRLLDELPRAPSLHVPTYRALMDPDFFGGTEDREPWADLTDWGDVPPEGHR